MKDPVPQLTVVAKKRDEDYRSIVIEKLRFREQSLPEALAISIPTKKLALAAIS